MLKIYFETLDEFTYVDVQTYTLSDIWGITIFIVKSVLNL